MNLCSLLGINNVKQISRNTQKYNLPKPSLNSNLRHLAMWLGISAFILQEPMNDATIHMCSVWICSTLSRQRLCQLWHSLRNADRVAQWCEHRPHLCTSSSPAILMGSFCQCGQKYAHEWPGRGHLLQQCFSRSSLYCGADSRSPTELMPPWGSLARLLGS